MPVLCHRSLKPAYSCIADIRTYFSSLRSPVHGHELIVVGDRVFTDVILANRMRLQSKLPLPQSALETSESKEKSGTSSHHRELVTSDPALHGEGAQGPLSIWTTGVWKRESMLMRCLESGLVRAVHRYSTPVCGQSDFSHFIIKEEVKPEFSRNFGLIERLLSRFRRP